MKFLDEAKIFVQSGDGGNGCIGFRREKFVEYGGPDGGDGGKGGSVWIETHDALNTLIDFRYQQHFKAKKGNNGSGSNRTGANAADVVLKVPIGTQIFYEDKKTLLIDMNEKGMRFCLAKGGDGGFGNTHFKSPVNQAPKKALPGWPGEEQWLWLRLKLIADVGLLGFPNAGKSTFLSVVSRAKPKIADYPFTTLKPQLGVAYAYEQEIVLADLPGLIENAHLGHGLGHRFLGHVERCKVLLHVIDITQEDPVQAYQTIRHELKEYLPALCKKQEVVILNKSDALSSEEVETIANNFSLKTKTKPMVISSVAKIGTQAVIEKLVAIIYDLYADKDY